MTELEQFTPNSYTAPPRVIPCHLQNQLLEARIETWPTRTSPATEGSPLSPHQLSMPTEDRVRLHQHPDQSRTAHPSAQRCHDRPVRHAQLRPLHLAAHHAQLV